MGNRAVITNNMEGVGIYLHWNGGRDSVEAFLQYCKLRGFRADDYGLARLAQVICNFFGGGLSVGVDLVKKLDCDNGDNGVYIIKDWQIVDRKYFEGPEQSGYDMNEFLQAIDEAQPEGERLGKYLTAKPAALDEVKPGDKVIFLDDLHGVPVESVVIGIGEAGKVVNGRDVQGVPYINKYGTDDPADNINNYLNKYDFRIITEEEPKAAELTINEELKGIELKFAARPSQDIRTALKEKGFKWHNKKAVWYAKKNPENIAFAEQIVKQIIG